jgi:hypothetical protein
VIGAPSLNPGKKSRSRGLENRATRPKKLRKPYSFSAANETRSLSNGDARMGRLSNNGKRPSTDVVRPGKNAVKKIIKKVNKDLPTNVEDELNNEIEKSLHLLKTQKGIEVREDHKE